MNKGKTIYDLYVNDVESGKWRCTVMENGLQCTQLLAKHPNTSSRIDHIKRKHRDICLISSKPGSTPVNIGGKMQQKITSMNADPYPRDCPKNLVLNRAVLNYIIGNNLPISTVDNPLFLEMLHTFDSRYQQR